MVQDSAISTKFFYPQGICRVSAEKEKRIYLNNGAK